MKTRIFNFIHGTLLAWPCSFLPAWLLNAAWDHYYTDYPTKRSIKWYVSHNAGALKNRRRRLQGKEPF